MFSLAKFYSLSLALSFLTNSLSGLGKVTQLDLPFYNIQACGVFVQAQIYTGDGMFQKNSGRR